jgi:hypothetical protein
MENDKTIYLKDLNVASLLGKHEEANIPSDLPMRKWLFSWLLDTNIPGNMQKSVDKWLGILIVANLFSLMFEQVPAVFEPNKQWFHIFDIFSVAVFTVSTCCACTWRQKTLNSIRKNMLAWVLSGAPSPSLTSWQLHPFTCKPSCLLTCACCGLCGCCEF